MAAEDIFTAIFLTLNFPDRSDDWVEMCSTFLNLLRQTSISKLGKNTFCTFDYL